ncbi:MAG: lytic transglycosylase domain-containing protein [Actinomycetota bacterium]|nr:lytic transglycosylase domain-containing protein [Actinomycetota bacterium]
MAKHTSVFQPEGRRTGAAASVDGRHIRSGWSLPVFGFLATCSFLLVSIVEPYSGAYATTPETVAPAVQPQEPQSLTVAGDHEVEAERDGFKVVELPKPKPKPEPVAAPSTDSGGEAAAAPAPAPVAGPVDPGSAQAIAHDMVLARGWGEGEFNCLVSLWNKESGWNVYAQNPSSGAYGIPQALPGNKMASAGADWQTNPATQISWGLGYISGRYGTPCGAWNHSQSVGWY